MIAQPPFASYAEFTTAVVSLVEPLLPGGLDAKMRFSGCYGEWGWPSSDSATLRGRRALFLERLAAKAEDVTSVDSSLYKTRLGPASLMSLLDHSAYARNIPPDSNKVIVLMFRLAIRPTPECAGRLRRVEEPVRMNLPRP